MTARQIIEAESPKKALHHARNPNEVEHRDAQYQWTVSGTPEYPDHWQAMWTPMFMRKHPGIRGCPLGIAAVSGERGKFHALNDLVNRTNRESKTDFFIRIREISGTRQNEAVLHPNPRTLKAWDRVSGLNVNQQDRDRTLKRHKIVVDPEYIPHANANMDIHVPEVVPWDRASVAHELVHREQFRKARGAAKAASLHYKHKTTKHGDMLEPSGDLNAKAFGAYLRHPYEIMAHAYNVAEEMRRMFGERALEAARQGQWRKTVTGSFVMDNYGPQSPEGRRFLKDLVAYLSHSEKGGEKR